MARPLPRRPAGLAAVQPAALPLCCAIAASCSTRSTMRRFRLASSPATASVASSCGPTGRASTCSHRPSSPGPGCRLQRLVAREFLQTRILFLRLDVWLRASALGFLATVLLLSSSHSISTSAGCCSCTCSMACCRAASSPWRPSWCGEAGPQRPHLPAGLGRALAGVIVAALHVVCAVPSNFWTGCALQIGPGSRCC